MNNKTDLESAVNIERQTAEILASLEGLLHKLTLSAGPASGVVDAS